MTYTFWEFARQFARLPPYLRLWLWWLTFLTGIVPLFLIRWKAARVVIAFQLGNFLFGSWLGMKFGLVRLLSLSHLVFWTPMVIYLWLHLVEFPPGTVRGIWARLFVTTVVVSLFIDVVEVARYIGGSRGPLV